MVHSKCTCDIAACMQSNNVTVCRASFSKKRTTLIRYGQTQLCLVYLNSINYKHAQSCYNY